MPAGLGSGWVSTSCSSAAASHTTRPISWQTARGTWTTTCKQTWRMRGAVAWHQWVSRGTQRRGGCACPPPSPPQSDAAEPPQPPPSPAPTSSRSHAGDRSCPCGWSSTAQSAQRVSAPAFVRPRRLRGSATGAALQRGPKCIQLICERPLCTCTAWCTAFGRQALFCRLGAVPLHGGYTLVV